VLFVGRRCLEGQCCERQTEERALIANEVDESYQQSDYLAA